MSWFNKFIPNSPLFTKQASIFVIFSQWSPFHPTHLLLRAKVNKIFSTPSDGTYASGCWNTFLTHCSVKFHLGIWFPCVPLSTTQLSAWLVVSSFKTFMSGFSWWPIVTVKLKSYNNALGNAHIQRQSPTSSDTQIHSLNLRCQYLRTVAQYLVNYRKWNIILTVALIGTAIKDASKLLSF